MAGRIFGTWVGLSYRIGLGLAMAIGAASAHEFWMEPATTRAEVGDVVPLTLAVGQNFVGDTQIMVPDLAVRFEAIGPGGARSVAGDFAADPAGRLEVEAEGLYTVVYQNRPELLVLDPETFATYAEQDGVEHALAARAAAGRSGAAARERYTRYPKTFVLAGPEAAGARATQPAGLRFELVPQQNPFRIRAGGRITVRVLYEDRPLEGILVQAFHKGRSEKLARERSDADGRATLVLPLAGRWLISAVHLIPAAAADVDWESFWASITLDVPPG